MIGLKLSDALNIVRQTLSPDIVKQKGAVELKIGRSNPKSNSQNASKSSKTDQKLPLVGDLLPSKAPAPIPKKESTQPRHNDSYIMATQFGIKKIPIDPKINRSQSLKALQYINGQSTEDSVIYKGNVFIVNRGASFRWSFGPHSAWDSIESTIIFTTHPRLLLQENP